MLRVPFVLVTALLVGCAYTSTDLAISNYSGSGWEREPMASSDMEGFQAPCGEHILHLYANRLLASEGGSYLALGVLPIGSADFINHGLDGFHFSYSYEGLPLSCSKSETRVLANGVTVSNIEIHQAENIKSACIAKIPYEVSQLREIEIEFPKLTVCEVSPIRIQFNTQSQYKYDSINP